MINFIKFNDAEDKKYKYINPDNIEEVEEDFDYENKGYTHISLTSGLYINTDEPLEDVLNRINGTKLKEPVKQWMPDDDDYFYFVEMNGEVSREHPIDPQRYSEDLIRLLMHNYFYTESEAETHRNEMLEKYKMIYILGMEGEIQ